MPSGSVTTLSPAIVALVTQTMQAALQAHASSSAAGLTLPSSNAPSTSSSPPSLGSVAASLCDSGTGFQSGQATSATSQGRPVPFVVPSFVLTFAAPQLTLVSSMARSLSGVSTGTSRVNDAVSVPSQTSSILTEQLFVVGPGFSAVPAKLISQIVAGKYVDLSNLLAANLACSDPEPQLLLDGRLVLTTPPKKQRRHIQDLASWTEAFTIFALILTTYFPQRWKDLTLYKLLILRIHRQFNGQVWFAYDQAF